MFPCFKLDLEQDPLMLSNPILISIANPFPVTQLLTRSHFESRSGSYMNLEKRRASNPPLCAPISVLEVCCIKPCFGVAALSLSEASQSVQASGNIISSSMQKTPSTLTLHSPRRTAIGGTDFTTQSENPRCIPQRARVPTVLHLTEHSHVPSSLNDTEE